MTNKEAIEVLRSMKSDFPLPKAAQTRRAQNDALDAAIKALKAEPCDDAISRRAAIDVIEAGRLTKLIDAETAVNGLKALLSVQPEPQWIPFVLRPTTDEGKEVFSDLDYFLDGKLPDDGQRILVTVRVSGHEEVQFDEFYSDFDGSYLDGQYEIGTEAVAWMPLPKPYKEGDE